VSSPDVSVVLPFRDAAATLRESIDSLREQTLWRFECLLVDDGSSDDSADIATTAATGDPRFRVLRGGAGLVAALNLAIGAARAPLIARMDADDICLPERLAAQCDALSADETLSGVGCLVECMSADAEGMRRYVEWLNSVVTPEAIRAAIFVESPLAHPSVMLRAEIVRRAGGYRSTGGPEDYDLWLRLVLSGHRLGKVPRLLLRWRDSPHRLSRRDARYSAAQFLATKLAHFPSAVSPAQTLEVWGAGPTARAWGRALQARGYRLRRFVDIAPRRWGRSLLGVPIEPPQQVDDAAFALVAVGSRGAREWIEAHLAAHGLAPWRNYLCVA
jgi:glycosyltransferase involved in cell wall biosynthesis